MLASVLGEISFDTAAKPARAPAPAPAAPVTAPPQYAPADTQAFAAQLAERDMQIAELQQAVIELAGAIEQHPGDGGEAAALRHQVMQLEARLSEQEHTIRHTLTMMIEWIESDTPRRAAA